MDDRPSISAPPPPGRGDTQQLERPVQDSCLEGPAPRFRSGPLNRGLLSVLVSLSVWAGPADCKPVVCTEPDELWSVTFEEKAVPGKWRVTFGRTGYFVVEKYEPTRVVYSAPSSDEKASTNGRERTECHWKALMDGGICYFSESYKESAFQLRTATKDVDASADATKQVLEFQSTLDHWRVLDERKGKSELCPRLRFVEQVSILPKGLEFRYQLTALEDLVAEHLGAYVQLPIERFAERPVRIYPDFARAVLPKPERHFLMVARGQTAVVAPETGWEMTLTAPKATEFHLNDQRGSKLNTYLVMADFLEKRRSPIPKGSQIEIGFSLHLGSRGDDGSVAESHVERGSPKCAPLPDDRETQGSWIGRYGAHTFVLCGIGAPLTWWVRGGRAYPNRVVPFAWYSGSTTDRARAWVASPETDCRVLTDPHDGVRKPAMFDDHGEVYPSGKRPGLYVDFDVPKGLYVLSLYLYDIDWLQHRSYLVSLRERDWGIGERPERTLNLERKKGPLLAAARARDLLHGVYKRFLVRGPLAVQVEIVTGESPNAILNGLFLDPVVSLYPLAARFSLSSDAEIRKSAGKLEPLLSEMHVKLGRAGADEIVTRLDKWSAALDAASTEAQNAESVEHDLYSAYLRLCRSALPAESPGVRNEAVSQYVKACFGGRPFPSSLEAMEGLFHLFLASGDGNAAAEIAEEFAALDVPAESRAGRAEECVKLCVEILDLSPWEPQHRRQVPCRYGAERRAGHLLIDGFSSFILDSGLPEADRADRLMRTAQRMIVSGLSDPCLRLLDRMNEAGLRWPDRHEYLELWIAATEREGRLDDTISGWKERLQAPDLSPEDRAKILDELAHHSRNNQDLEGAMKYWTRITRESPKNPIARRAYINLVHAYLSLRKPTEARIALESLADHFPEEVSQPLFKHLEKAIENVRRKAFESTE